MTVRQGGEVYGRFEWLAAAAVALTVSRFNQHFVHGAVREVAEVIHSGEALERGRGGSRLTSFRRR